MPSFSGESQQTPVRIQPGLILRRNVVVSLQIWDSVLERWLISSIPSPKLKSSQSRPANKSSKQVCMDQHKAPDKTPT